MNNLIDQIVCGYRITGVIGRGGMGEVFLAESAFLTEYKQQVAIKTLTATSQKQAELLRDLFVREANIQVQLKHQHIVSVIQFAIEDDRHFLILEYIPGYQHNGRHISNIAEVIRYETGPLQYQRALQLFVQALDALSYAHKFKYRWEGEERVGIVHRDIKPANLLLVDQNTIKISDFGIVKVQQRRGSVTEKLTPGTSAYMPPEAILGPQHFGLAELDARSDIYSLGVTLFEMLCGKLPFLPDKGVSVDVSVRRKHVEEAPSPPSTVHPGVPAAIDQIVLRALEKHPDRRFQSAEEFKQAILALDEPLNLGLRPAAGTRLIEASAQTGRVGAAATQAIAEQVAATAKLEEAAAAAKSASKSMLLLAAVFAVVFVAAVVLLLPRLLSGSSANVAAPVKSFEAPPSVALISGGEFMMGRDLTPEQKLFTVDGKGRDKVFNYDWPAHSVQVRPFYFDKTEVSNREYAEFVVATNRLPPDHWQGKTAPPADTEEMPVTFVAYRDAADYCIWRTAQRKDGLSYRLPTEEEWEFAARGENAGKPGAPLHLYPWGEQWVEGLANTKESRLNHPNIVNANPKSASPFGVLNLAGNVYEWTATDFTHYPGGDQQTPREDGYLGTYQVVRGGSFDFPKEYAMGTTRVWAKPTSKGERLGFRCAADAKP